MQVCNVCKIIKPLEEFHKNRKHRNGRQYTCKICACNRTQTWYKDNTQYAVGYASNYRDEHRSSMNAKQKAKYEAMRLAGIPRKYYRERSCAYTRKYFKDNPGWARSVNAKYRAAKLHATPTWANLDAIRKIYEIAKFVSDATGIQYEVDHIVPLRSKLVCGLHCEANLRVIPRDENIRKGNRIWPDMP